MSAARAGASYRHAYGVLEVGLRYGADASGATVREDRFRPILARGIPSRARCYAAGADDLSDLYTDALAPRDSRCRWCQARAHHTQQAHDREATR